MKREDHDYGPLFYYMTGMPDRFVESSQEMYLPMNLKAQGINGYQIPVEYYPDRGEEATISIVGSTKGYTII